MQTVISNISLSVFELVFLAGVPALLILIGLIYIIISNRQLNNLKHSLLEFMEKLDLLQGCKISHTAELEIYADESNCEQLKESVHNLIEDSREKYDGKWLPDLNNEFNLENLAEPQLKTCLQYTLSILVFTCGIIASMVLAIVPVINSNQFLNNPFMISIPLIVSILVSLFLLNQRNILLHGSVSIINRLIKKTERYVPVYTDKSGLALLVNEMTEHENSISQAMDKFNANLTDFVSEDFNENLSAAIKNVMQNDIAPPINKSSETLSALAESLSNKQIEGMALLAQNFSDELTLAMKNNFQSIQAELNSFNSLMDDTKNFIQDSIAILENSRQQNILLSREVSESIELMTVAKNDIANDMAKMADNLEVISSVTERMTSVYAGEDASLKEQINSLETALNNSLTTINSSIEQSQATISISDKLRNEQANQYEQLIGKMNSVIEDLSRIDTSINTSTANFNEKSDQKVQKSLTEFESALANIVERLIYTTAEIRDAVEALPFALSTDFRKDKQ
ncbi:MAG TPA: hypothetical protein GXZ43_04835 [Clostridiaceae bacterium]|mgnify:CR=1 FL=1|nr:hypothetical protein [Clostridiaceae bacterium]